MSSDVLISPLGRSPGAVSGMYYALLAQDPPVQVKEVIVVSTSDLLVGAASDILAELFERAGVKYRPRRITAPDLRGGERDIGPFVALMGHSIDQARQAKCTVHVGVTAGRSGMGALGALAAQLYGASKLYHLWVDEETEQAGLIHSERDVAGFRLDPPDERLKPPEYELVELPFFDFSPLHDVLNEFVRHGTVSDVTSPLGQLLSGTGLRRLTDVFPAPLTMAQADRLMDSRAALQKVSAEYQQLDQLSSRERAQRLNALREREDRILSEVVRILADAEIVGQEDCRRVLELVRQGAISELGTFVKGLRTEEQKQLFLRLLESLEKHKDVLAVAIAGVGVVVAGMSPVIELITLVLKLYGFSL